MKSNDKQKLLSALFIFLLAVPVFYLLGCSLPWARTALPAAPWYCLWVSGRRHVLSRLLLSFSGAALLSLLALTRKSRS